MSINKSNIVLTKCNCGFEAYIEEFESKGNYRVVAPSIHMGSFEHFIDIKCQKCGKIFETQL